MEKVAFGPGDALIVTDVQNDFLPGGSLAVPHGDEVIPILNRYINLFHSKELPIFATRDWHPANHCSFIEQGGPWVPHCMAGTSGASFSPLLKLPYDVVIVSKATKLEKDAYSTFEGTELDPLLHSLGVHRIIIGGLATDYCILNSVKDAVRLNYRVIVLGDAVRAINVHPEDGTLAMEEMVRLGADIIWEKGSS